MAFFSELYFNITETWKDHADIHYSISLLIAIHTQLKFEPFSDQLYHVWISQRREK